MDAVDSMFLYSMFSPEDPLLIPSPNGMLLWLDILNLIAEKYGNPFRTSYQGIPHPVHRLGRSESQQGHDSPAKAIGEYEAWTWRSPLESENLKRTNVGSRAASKSIEAT